MDFGTLFGGLAGGLAQGAETGIALSQKQQQLDMQESQQKLGLITAMSNMRKIPLELRKVVMPGVLADFEKKYNIAIPDSYKAAATKLEDDTWSTFIDTNVKALAPKGADMASITKSIQGLGDVEEQLKVLDYMRKVKQGDDLSGYRSANLGIKAAGTTTVTTPDVTGTGATTVRKPNLGAPPGTAPANAPPAAPGTPPQAPQNESLMPGGDPAARMAEAGAYKPPVPGDTVLPSNKAIGTGQQTEAVPASDIPKLAGDTTKTGEDYLKTLPPGFAERVKQIANYAGAPMKGSKVAEATMKAVLQYDPNYDEKNWTSYNKAMRDFSPSGEAGRNVRSLTTALGHMGTMAEMYQALNSGNSPIINAVTNKVRQQLGKPEVTNAEAARVALADELKRVFTVVGAGSEADRKAWFETLSTAKSPAQARGVLETMSNLLDSRIGALEKQWKDSGPPGRAVPGMDTPDVIKARETLKKFADEGRPKAPVTPQGVTVKRTGSLNGTPVYEGSDGGIYDFTGKRIK